VRIAAVYDPTPPTGGSAFQNIFGCGLKDLYDEIFQIIYDTTVVISPLKTFRGSAKGKGTVAAWDLSPQLNVAFKTGLSAAGWAPFKAPGSTDPHSSIDWFKSKPTGMKYGPEKFGIGLEVQFGHHYQMAQDIRRLAEAQLNGSTVAGIVIVPSDALAEHKADRGESFSDAKDQLDKDIQRAIAQRSMLYPSIAIIAVEHGPPRSQSRNSSESSEELN